jgi:hypothetical protein
MPRSRLARMESAVFSRLNRYVEWHRLPTPLAVLNLKVLRDDLREHNLHDTFVAGGERVRQPPSELLPYRTYDGSNCDPFDRDMGMALTRFDRNTPMDLTWPEAEPGLLEPNPRLISQRLLGRERFIPATTLNLVAAAWIQFQNHDWFSHGDNTEVDPFEITLSPGDVWSECPMRIRRSRPDAVAHIPGGAPPTFVNTVTHWWDGSQIYGSSEKRCRQLRTGADGMMILENGRLPGESDPELAGLDLTGFSDNYWVGLSMMHTLFVKEHNAICEHLRAAYPTWDDERLFLTARLVNTALMAKIHTIEWTPGILNNPGVRHAMNANWYGLLGRWTKNHLGRVGRSEALSGIIGSATEHHTAQFSTTEEFVCCYRLHPLIPDEYEIRSHRNGALVDRTDFGTLQGRDTRPALDRWGMSDLWYSFGTAHPGSITLHNHPEALRNLVRMTGEHLDVGTVDVLRDRERGIPRYNAFRETLRKRPVEDFADLTPNQRWAKEIREVYNGDIDRVDTLIGMYAEPRPKGFGFSDTAFRIFVLMASRRLKSDRFFTVDYRPEVYTPEGLRWIEDNTMVDVLLRHHPELEPALSGVTNAFLPWIRDG